jgi:hypothetical protein
MDFFIHTFKMPATATPPADPPRRGICPSTACPGGQGKKQSPAPANPCQGRGSFIFLNLLTESSPFLKHLKGAWRLIRRLPENEKRILKSKGAACESSHPDKCRISVPPVALKCLLCRKNQRHEIVWSLNSLPGDEKPSGGGYDPNVD